MRAVLLPTFEFYLDDDRYSVPTLRLVTAEDERVAQAVAQRLLEESRHHLGVEICLEGERVTGLGSFANRLLPPETRQRPEPQD